MSVENVPKLGMLHPYGIPLLGQIIRNVERSVEADSVPPSHIFHPGIVKV